MEYSWEEHGLEIHRDLMPHDLIDSYVRRRGTDIQPWPYPTPYMDVPEIRELCFHRPLVEILGRVLREPPLLHLNLTGFRSTQRAWHQDGYLNPEAVGDAYVAVWMALDTIHAGSGPFEFLPGSHRWDGRLSRADALAMGTDEERKDPGWDVHWPSWTQEKVGAYWQEQIDRRSAEVHKFLPAHKGDVLVWHPWTVHRGSTPRTPDLERRALISHYSGLAHRPDMPRRAPHPNGGFWAQLKGRSWSDQLGDGSR